MRGSRTVDERLLNDLAAIEAADPGQMLRATASAGAQVRESAALAAEANLASLASEGRPARGRRRRSGHRRPHR